jgi:hypothetical protein
MANARQSTSFFPRDAPLQQDTLQPFLQRIE